MNALKLGTVVFFTFALGCSDETGASNANVPVPDSIESPNDAADSDGPEAETEDVNVGSPGKNTCVTTADCASSEATSGRICLEGICVPCVETEECTGEDSYGPQFQCILGACSEVILLETGEACESDGACNSGLCWEGLCDDCLLGTVGCPCDEFDCEGGLVCDETTMICISAIGCADAGCVENQKCEEAKEGADAKCLDECEEGYVFEGTGPECVKTDPCDLSIPGSVGALCDAQNKVCTLDSDTGAATCGDCKPLYLEDEGDCVLSSEVTECATDSDCVPGQWCANVPNDTNTPLQSICVSDWPCLDEEGKSDKSMVLIAGECASCDFECSGPGLTGGFYPEGTSNGSCVCETEEGWFYSLGGDIKAVECDSDGDGWAKLSARQWVESNDKALSANARCSIGRFNRVLMQNEYNESRTIYLCQEGLKIDEECSQDESIAMYEADAIDSNAGVLDDSESYPAYGELTFDAADLNPMTKACVNSLGDFNGNNVADMNEGHNKGPSENYPIAADVRLLEFTFFVELAEGFFVPEDSGAAGQFVISERSRCDGAVDGLPMGYEGLDPYWRECTRRRHSNYDEAEPTPGNDFAKWSCSGLDVTEGSCPAISTPPTTTPSAHPYGICTVTLPNDPETWRGMGHHSQFACRALKETPSKAWEVSVSDVEDEHLDVCALEMDTGNLTCSSVMPVENLVGWVATPFKKYSTPDGYLSGCIDEAIEWGPGSACAGTVDEEGDSFQPVTEANQFGKMGCKTHCFYSGDECVPEDTAGTPLMGECAKSAILVCDEEAQVDVCIQTKFPESEIDGNGLDNNCDGWADIDVSTSVFVNASSPSSVANGTPEAPFKNLADALGVMVVQGELNSCASNCDPGNQNAGNCWCDEACVANDDCCPDYVEFCVDSSSSCASNCGAFASDGCWCEASCVNAGDCCADYEYVCVNGGQEPVPQIEKKTTLYVTGDVEFSGTLEMPAGRVVGGMDPDWSKVDGVSTFTHLSGPPNAPAISVKYLGEETLTIENVALHLQTQTQPFNEFETIDVLIGMTVFDSSVALKNFTLTSDSFQEPPSLGEQSKATDGSDGAKGGSGGQAFCVNSAISSNLGGSGGTGGAANYVYYLNGSSSDYVQNAGGAGGKAGYCDDYLPVDGAKGHYSKTTGPLGVPIGPLPGNLTTLSLQGSGGAATDYDSDVPCSAYFNDSKPTGVNAGKDGAAGPALNEVVGADAAEIGFSWDWNATPGVVRTAGGKGPNGWPGQGGGGGGGGGGGCDWNDSWGTGGGGGGGGGAGGVGGDGGMSGVSKVGIWASNATVTLDANSNIDIGTAGNGQVGQSGGHGGDGGLGGGADPSDPSNYDAVSLGTLFLCDAVCELNDARIGGRGGKGGDGSQGGQGGPGRGGAAVGVLADSYSTITPDVDTIQSGVGGKSATGDSLDGPGYACGTYSNGMLSGKACD